MNFKLGAWTLLLLLLLLLLLSEHLCSALSLNKIPNALHALCQYVANRKHLSERLKESKVSMSTVRYSGRLFHADGPAQENALLPAVIGGPCRAHGVHVHNR